MMMTSDPFTLPMAGRNTGEMVSTRFSFRTFVTTLTMFDRYGLHAYPSQTPSQTVRNHP
jgi:hypothetical protein